MLQVLLSSIYSFNMDGLDHIFLNEFQETLKLKKNLFPGLWLHIHITYIMK